MITQCEADKLVFLDESGVNTDLSRRYGRAIGGERSVDKTPLNTPANTTILSSVRRNGETAYTIYSGGTTREKFLDYLKNTLIPTLHEDSAADWIIAIQEIIKEYQRQKTNQRSRKGGSARKPQQYHAEKANRIVFSAISILINVLSAFVMGCLILGGAFFAVLSYRAERITVRNDIKLVACVDYFSGVTVDYYQYKNPLFYGKRLGFFQSQK